MRCVCVCTKRCLLFCFYYCGHKSRVFLQSAVSAAPKWSKRSMRERKALLLNVHLGLKLLLLLLLLLLHRRQQSALCTVIQIANYCQHQIYETVRSFTHTHRMKKCKLISTERALIDRAEFLLFRVLLLLLSRQRRRRRRRRKARQESKVLANEKQRVRKTLLSTVGETNRRAGRFLLSVTRKQRRQEH